MSKDTASYSCSLSPPLVQLCEHHSPSIFGLSPTTHDLPSLDLDTTLRPSQIMSATCLQVRIVVRGRRIDRFV